MADPVHGLNVHALRGQVQRSEPARKPAGPAGKPFQQILQEAAGPGEVTFSGHAQDRLRVRNIQLSSTDRLRLNHGVEKAAEKGARESLVLLDNQAFLVNIKNRTVITAIGKEDLKDRVFTNIDSTVVL